MQISLDTRDKIIVAVFSVDWTILFFFIQKSNKIDKILINSIL